MGKLLIDFFKKKNRNYNDLNKNAKRDFVILTILLVAGFIFLSFAFFEVLYFICNIIGSFVSKAPYQSLVELKITAPLLVACFGGIYSITVLSRLLYTNKMCNKNKLLFKNGIVMLSIFLFVLIYFIVGLISGLYINPSNQDIHHKMIFIEMILSCVIYFIFGLTSLLCSLKIKNFACDIPCFENSHKLLIKILRGIGSVIILLATSYAFSALIHGTYTIDLSRNIDYTKDATFYVVTLILMFITCLLMIVIYHFLYLPLKKGYRLKFQLFASIVLLVVNLIVFVLYEVAHAQYPNAPIVSCYAILPIDFTATMNVFGKIYGAINLLTPLTSLIIAMLKLRRLKNN